MVLSRADRYSCQAESISILEKKLNELEQFVQKDQKEETLYFYSELYKLDKKINQIEADIKIEEDFQIQYDEQAIFRGILQSIKISGCAQIKTKDLIFPTGDIYLIEAKRYSLKPDIKFLNEAAFCQLNKQLYSSGGKASTFTSTDFFFRCNAYGACQKFTPMKERRSLHSLTGRRNIIVASGGGQSNQIQKSCQEYNIINSNWRALPNLVTGLKKHSSCILGSYRIFCFTNDSQSGIQYLDIGKSQSWKKIVPTKKYTIKSTFIVFPLRQKIFILSATEPSTIVFNEDGMCQYVGKSNFRPSAIEPSALVVGKNCVYTCNKELVLWKFDGLRWDKQIPKNQSDHSN